MKTPKRSSIVSLLLMVLAIRAADAGDLVVMSGSEPLKSQVNGSKEAVRLVFLGSPT